MGNVIQLRPATKPAENDILMFMHCNECLKEYGAGPYQQDIEVGWTEKGLQLWCRRHQKSIINLDFEGCAHPAI